MAQHRNSYKSKQVSLICFKEQAGFDLHFMKQQFMNSYFAIRLYGSVLEQTDYNRTFACYIILGMNDTV